MAEYIMGTDGDQGSWITGERIVRCVDCKRHAERQVPNAHGWITCGRDGKFVKPSGFCAWGERKDD